MDYLWPHPLISGDWASLHNLQSFIKYKWKFQFWPYQESINGSYALFKATLRCPGIPFTMPLFLLSAVSWCYVLWCLSKLEYCPYYYDKYFQVNFVWLLVGVGCKCFLECEKGGFFCIFFLPRKTWNNLSAWKEITWQSCIHHPMLMFYLFHALIMTPFSCFLLFCLIFSSIQRALPLLLEDKYFRISKRWLWNMDFVPHHYMTERFTVSGKL